MLKNYLRIAIRSIGRQKLYAAINIVGMAVSLASALLILLFVRSESSYDAYLEDADRVFRVTLSETPRDGSTSVNQALISPAVGPKLLEEFPQISRMARMTPVGPLLSWGNQHIIPDRVYWADPEIFEIMSVEVLIGNPVQDLNEPFTLALSASLARQLFGDAEPIGQPVRVNDGDDFRVVAVYADLPVDTHLHFDAIGSIASIERWFTGRPMNEVWDSPNYLTYVKLDSREAESDLAIRLEHFMDSVQGVNVPSAARVRLQNVRDIHLHSTAMAEMEPQGSSETVVLFAFIAFFIVLIASINFTNLAVAASTRRDREVGIRKAAGAARRQLVGQFVGESMVITALSMLLAVGMTLLALPTVNAFIGTSLSLSDFTTTSLIGTLVMGCLIVGTLAGSYPAFYLSRLRPSDILRGRTIGGRSGSTLRGSLIVLQFSIAVILMLATLIVFRQLAYVRTQDMGFDSKNVIVLPSIREIAENFEPFRSQLLQNRDILDVAQSNPSLLNNLIPPFDGTAYHDDRTETATIYPMWIDAHYFQTLNIPFLAGRDFELERASDQERGLILNETGARRFGFREPVEAIGHEIQYGGVRREVIGVVADFHQESLHKAIIPMGFYQDPRNFRSISVKFSTTDFPALVKFLEAKWAMYLSNRPLEFDFLDERVTAAYNTDRRLGILFGTFSFLGIWVSCLGLFGIAAVTVQRRRKEIGIRKVVGASLFQLVFSISMEFIKLSGIAILAGGIAGTVLMSRWLENFAYHGSIGLAPIAIVGLMTVAAALLAVFYEAFTAASANPVESLRIE